jgi:hypothetical protein
MPFQKQEEKMLIEKERVAMKKRKEDFMLLTALTVGRDPQVLVAHNFYKDMILNEIDAKWLWRHRRARLRRHR